MQREHIVVAGAGIVGVSIAYHLAKRGARVTIVEALNPGAGATGKSFGWINATFSKRPRAYFDLNHRAMAEWRRFEMELNGRLKVRRGGSITWFPAGPEAEELQASVAQHQRWGYDARLIDGDELRKLAPAVDPGVWSVACYAEEDATVEPVDAVTVLLEHAQELGVELRCPCRVTATPVPRVETNQGSIEASTVVLACGVDLPGLARRTGFRVPLKESPGVLIHTSPQRELIDAVIVAPEVHCKQGLDGRIVAGGPVVAGVGTATTEAADTDQILRQLRKILPALGDVDAERVTLGYRVMPEDEYPILGFPTACPNVYVAAMHSGVTLAPLVGRMAATEILDRVPVDALRPYRPDRFTS